MKRLLPVALAAAVCLGGNAARGYPLDAFEETGIPRLEVYRLTQEALMRARVLSKGALLPSARIRLRLLDHRDLGLPEPEPEFSAAVKRLLGADAPRYAVAVLDLSDLENPRYAGHNADRIQNPGSLGKIAVALAWFQALADLYPDDIEARRSLLFHTPVVANGFIHTDRHAVPFCQPGDPKVERRPIREGDRANLWTYMDWMCSSSSNAATSMLMSHLVLLKRFGLDYPVSEEKAARFFEETPKTELRRIFLDAIQTPIARNGLDPQRLRQGSFFTREGKHRVPGTSSRATSREILRYMLLLEQGRLVDSFSSLEIKRLLYLTDQRVRYAASPALRNSAVYFKSGSLYSCRPEPGFECKRYHGNVKNYMNSVASVESIDESPPLHYIAVVSSNILRKNAAEQHRMLGTRIHHLIRSFHAPTGAERAAGASTDETTTTTSER